MNTDAALRTPMAQQVLTLSLAALFTAGMLGAVLDIGADDQEALMASQAD